MSRGTWIFIRNAAVCSRGGSTPIVLLKIQASHTSLSPLASSLAARQEDWYGNLG